MKCMTCERDAMPGSAICGKASCDRTMRMLTSAGTHNAYHRGLITLEQRDDMLERINGSAAKGKEYESPCDINAHRKKGV